MDESDMSARGWLKQAADFRTAGATIEGEKQYLTKTGGFFRI